MVIRKIPHYDFSALQLAAPDNADFLQGCFFFNTENKWILEANCTMRTNDGEKQDTFPLRLPLSAPFAQGAALTLDFDKIRTLPRKPPNG